MSSCVGNTCGTGGWNGPLPGDPDNNIALSARTVFGGVVVSWSYPAINGHAVAHTEVFRGVTNNSAAAVMLDRAGGSSYFDRVNPTTQTQYYYWIEVVSINGTRGARLGPVSAIAQPQSKQTLESLTALIDESLLAQTLKTSISGITLNHLALIKEIEDRLANNKALQDALAAVQGGLDEALTYVLNQTTELRTADSAMVNQINAIAAGLNDNKAAIVEERTVRVGKDEAFASQVTTLFTETADNKAAIISERTARTDADSAMAQDVTTLYARAATNTSAITNERTARANADSALASDITQLSTNVANSFAAVNQTTSALSTKVNATASSVTTVEANLYNVATVQTGMKADVNSLTGQVNAIWYAKVQVNDLIGGFGIANDGRIVDAGFDVDRFWVGRTGPDRVKPFIISDGIVYINKARIRDADIDTLKIAGNSVISGTYAEGGATSVAAGGSRTLINRTINLGDDFNSGLIVSASVGASASDDATIGFRVLIDGVVCGDQRASVMGGYGFIFPVNGFGYASGGFATVTLQAYSPTTGAGANQPFSVGASCMSVMGGKR
jgi:hypothetical protein